LTSVDTSACPQLLAADDTESAACLIALVVSRRHWQAEIFAFELWLQQKGRVAL